MFETLINLPAPTSLPPAPPAGAREQPQEVLLERVRAQDPEGWQQLLRLYGPVVHSWCRRWGLQAADIVDVAQDVFCSLLRRVGRFQLDHEGGLGGWIRVITHNKLRDLHRRRHRAPLSGGDTCERLLKVPQSPPPGPRGEEPFHQALLLLRAEFEERTWQAFWRSVVDEQASTAVGAELDMTPNAVRKAKSRVLRRLRETLTPDEEKSSGRDAPLRCNC